MSPIRRLLSERHWGYRRAIASDQALSPEERSLRRRVLPGGMVKLEIVLSPDEADLVMRALDGARESERGDATADEEVAGVSAETSRAPSRAEAMVALAENFLAGRVSSGNGGERYQVMIHFDQEPLAPDGQWAATLEDGTRVSAEAFRRVACDCGLVGVGGTDAQLNIGRRSRSIPAAIRRALLVRDRGCCFPSCTNHRFLHAHHIEHWLKGGETSVGNLCLLCTAHHRMVHEGGWKISWESDGTLSFAAPTGQPLTAEPRQWDQDILAWLREWADEHHVDVGPDSNLPMWDGTRPDYDWAVGALVAAE